MLLAGITCFNCIASYFGLELKVLNYIAGISVIFVAYLYLASYTFKLCEYYRMFLHYYVIMNIFNIIDFYIGVPISDVEMMILYSIITIISMFVIIYLKFFKKQ